MTAAEIAAAALPEVPASKRNVNAMAGRQGWPWQDRKGRGGGREYPLSALPDAAQRELARRELAPAPAPPVPFSAAPTPALLHRPAELADWQRNCADARAALLDAIERLVPLAGSLNKAIDEFVSAAAEGRLKAPLDGLVVVANNRRGEERGLSARTLKRWRADLRDGGWDALVPRDTARPVEIPAWGEILLKHYRRPQKPSLAMAMERMAEELPASLMPNFSKARRFLASLTPQVRERGRMGSNARLALRGHKRRDFSMLDPMELVLADGHSMKGEVRHPELPSAIAPELCTLIDARTRYIFGWSAGFSESGAVVMDCLRHGVSNLGLFDVLYTDNGSGFVNKVISDQRITGLIARMFASHNRAIAGRAQARGVIERVQGSLWKRSARKLPTYRGEDMDDEARRNVVKMIRGDVLHGTARVLMPWAAFLAWCQAEVDAYNARPNTALPKVLDPATGRERHQSPAEALQGCMDAGWQPDRPSDLVLNDLFRPYMERTTFRGEVKLPWGRYYDRALDDFHGQRVRVGYEVQDGSVVYVRTHQDGRLICIARRDANVIPGLPQTARDHNKLRSVERRAALQRQHLELVEAERPVMAIDAEAVEVFGTALPPPDEPAAEPQADTVDATGRPLRFTSPIEYAAWALLNPEHPSIDEADRVELREILTNWNDRLVLHGMGVLTQANEKRLLGVEDQAAAG